MSETAELSAATERLMLVALGVVLGLSGAAVLPLLLPWAPAVVPVSSAAGLALLPYAIAWLVPRLRRALSGPHVSLIAVTLSLGCALATLFLLHLYRGQVRVLNHGDEPFVLWVDGKRVARVEPSSGESALAGVELSVPAGERELSVVSVGGRELFRAHELIEGGSPHLFAPLSAGYCFTIERRSYGQAGRPTLEVVPLEGENPFWVLPEGVSWFTPNPEPGPLQTSGGTLSCLRQRRCVSH